MPITIAELQKKYAERIDRLDFELLIAHTTKKQREFILAHPEYQLTKNCVIKIAEFIKRRIDDEPLSYIIGCKEFYGLSFSVTPATLIPRPETEIMIHLVLRDIISHTRHNNSPHLYMVDVGTGSGNIIISLAKELEKTELPSDYCYSLYGTDVSKNALAVAKKNAINNNISKKIKFLPGNLLTPFINNCKSNVENSTIIILANLPYLSKKIYSTTHPTVKKYEPKSALYSSQKGLAHYQNLFQQIKRFKNASRTMSIMCYIEISPEQKKILPALIKKIFSSASFEFEKDLSKKWRFCKIKL